MLEEFEKPHILEKEEKINEIRKEHENKIEEEFVNVKTEIVLTRPLMENKNITF